MSTSSTINSAPTLQSQTYIGGADADPDLDIRKAIADTARSNVGSHNWLDTAGSNKCNAFVFDMLTQVGHAPPKLGGSYRYYLGYQLGITSLLKYAPIAGQWANAGTVRDSKLDSRFGRTATSTTGRHHCRKDQLQ